MMPEPDCYSLDPRQRLEGAKEMLREALVGMDATVSTWEPAKHVLGLWEYATLQVDGRTIRLGVSGGGVVSVGRHPFDPQGKLNISVASIKASIEAIASGQRSPR